jgi:hypothetical protein
MILKKAYSGTGMATWCAAVTLLVLLLANSYPALSQQVKQKPARILFLMDASSSMLSEWKAPESRFKAASRIVSAIVDSIHAVNSDVAFAVRVFGNQYPAQDKNCFDSRLEVPFNLANDEQIKARLRYLNPRGFSPIAWSLKETAEKDFTQSDAYAYSIILITDGGESCGGDICATVTSLLDKKISFKPYILSLVDYEPLKKQYECLGKYLTVAQEKDVVPAINTIINDNRKVLTIKASGLRRQQDPPVPKAVAAVTKPIAPPPAVKPEPVVIKKEPEVVKEVPVPVKKETPPPVKKEEPVIISEPVVVREKKQVDRISIAMKLRTMNLLYTLPYGIPVHVPGLKLKPYIEEKPAIDKSVIPQSGVAARPAPTTKPVIIEPTAVKPKTVTTKAVRKPEKKEEQLDFVVKTEEAKESTLQIYFTNGQGKFYRTEPRLVIKDSKTGKEVKNIYRNLTNGEPDPIKLEPGTYDITVPGSKSKANGVLIEPGKNKKYYIKVSNGSLAFFYPSAPDRPVTEYRALVSKRFEQGPVVKHPCDEELPYDPANYHIEINTLPPMMLNIDLDFNNVKLISIKEAGTVQISNKNNMGKVQFWYEHGDTFVPFYELNVNGNPAVQKLDFLPGTYQVRYFKGPAGPLAKAEVVFFRIKSNMTTTIELEK